MVLIAIVFIALMVYMVPGLYLARGMYAKAVKEINSRPVSVIPRKPERPRIKINEMLHISSPRKCSSLAGTGAACNCRYRDEWVELKNAWIDYNEWNAKYSHVKNGVYVEPEIDMKSIYLAVLGWPIVAGAMFIKGGAKNIPDYRAIERMENELKELS